MRRTATKAALTLTLLLGATARGAEEPIAPDKVPEAAMKAVKAKFPGAKITEAAKEEDAGKTVYEVTLTFEGSKYDVTATPEGKIELVEKTIPTASLPKAVAEAVKAKYPKGTIKLAEELIKGDETTYEVLVGGAEETDYELVLDAKGKITGEETKKAGDEKAEKKDK